MGALRLRASPLTGRMLPIEGGQVAPRRPRKSPLDQVLGKVAPGLDEFPSEKHAEAIGRILARWARGLLARPPEFEPLGESLSPDFRGARLKPAEETAVRGDAQLYVARCRPSDESVGRDGFMDDWAAMFPPPGALLVAEFQLTAIDETSESPLGLKTRVRYDLLATGARFHREQRVGVWEIDWVGSEQSRLLVRGWRTLEETRARASGAVFGDITAEVMGSNTSYRDQLLRGTDYWRTALDGASGIDVYGNNGIAVGDIDNDGFDDLYVCQPSGLPNRLYRNRGDGTFEDVTDAVGVGVLDNTACALFADVDNDGYQDLLVIRSDGPLLFLNQKNARFRLQPEAFRFSRSPQGTFTGAALADYDRDGRLDVYFCVYSYYQGLDQYRFPVPYDVAENGPPNFLFHNRGDGTFDDVTASSGVDQNNNRFSFAAGWCDYDRDGWPDLYVANDFGRNNLYRNKGNGTFSDVAAEAGVEDIGAGMSVCWFDYDNDLQWDLYVSNMWSAAGQRVTTQEAFLKGAPEDVRALYRKHADGNSLFRQDGSRRFGDASAPGRVAMGRWAWSSDTWDFDYDGYPDLYVANGMISGLQRDDLSSFFWRQVVARSPLTAEPSRAYELGWNAINERIRSDGTWSGYERNVFFLNNRDGTFSEASGAVGLDFEDDSRAFALADFDHDGRLEVFLKNRTAPQLRVLRNELRDLGDSIIFRLVGTESNRDAIGAELTVETASLRQRKFLQAGSGFLSQHAKELSFGLGRGPAGRQVRATARWPSGLVQSFEGLPINHRIEIKEGESRFQATPFRPAGALSAKPSSAPTSQPLPEAVGTWLLDPLPAPDFSLPDLEARRRTLSRFRGQPVLLYFWAASNARCLEELSELDRMQSTWSHEGVRLLAVNVDDPSDQPKVRAVMEERGVKVPILLADSETVGVYNILYRYLFDRRRDLTVPTSLLLDEHGLVVKVNQGPVAIEQIAKDLKAIPGSPEERIEKALPFRGQFYGGEFRRNYFTYGVAYSERGYLDEAMASFERVLRASPDYAEAHYNLGTLFLKKKAATEAGKHLKRALELKPNYPDALNNLGLLAAEAGQADQAAAYFAQALRLKPDYTLVLENLGNLYRRQRRMVEARELLERALQTDPDDAEVNYSLGMLSAETGESERARTFLEKAIKLRPGYPEALNNLGVLFFRTRQPEKAAAAFETCVEANPDFDQPYLNLARLYVATGEREKARQILRQLLARKPNHGLARKVLEELGR